MKKKIDLLDEKSDFAKDVLEQTPSWLVTWGNSFFFIFILILFALGWFIKYPDIVVSEVEITSQNPPINLVSKSNGQLSELFFSDKLIINKGDWIAVIQNSANTDDIKKIDSILNLSFEQILVNIPLNQNVELGESQISFNNLISKISQYKFYINYKPQDVGVRSNRDRINKVNNTQEEFKIQKEIARKEFEVKQIEYQRGLRMYEKGIISKADLDRMNIELLQFEKNYKSFNTNISNLEENKSEINKGNSELLLEKENKNLDLVTDINNAIQELKSQIVAWKNNYLIQAPVTGRLNFFEVWRLNQFVKNEQVLFSIVPEDPGQYFARAKIPIGNSGKVMVGQVVNIKLTNYPFEEFGLLTGKIEKITNVTSENVYFANISLDTGLVTNQKRKVQANNLIGQAEIVTEDLRMLERILYTIFKNLRQ